MDLPVNQRIILDLCGGTGAWSKQTKDNKDFWHYHKDVCDDCAEKNGLVMALGKLLYQTKS